MHFQAAIEAAVDGNTVLVAPGTYLETIDLLDRTLSLRSETGADLTILEGGHNREAIERRIRRLRAQR